MLIETLSTTGRKVTFPMGSDGSPTMKYTTLLVSIVKSFRKGIGGYLLSFPFPCLKLSQDLGNTTQYRQPSIAPGCEAVESSLGKETGGDKYYVFVEVLELCHKTMNWFKTSSCFWMAGLFLIKNTMAIVYNPIGVTCSLENPHSAGEEIGGQERQETCGYWLAHQRFLLMW